MIDDFFREEKGPLCTLILLGQQGCLSSIFSEHFRTHQMEQI
jgi:hypothetical protein